MYHGIDEIVSDLGRKWRIPHFKKRYEKRDYRKSAIPKEEKKKSIPKKTKVIRDQTLMSLKYPASRGVYACEVFVGMIVSRFGEKRILDALFSRHIDFIEFRKDSARKMDYMGFSEAEIAKAMKKDRSTIYFYLGRKNIISEEAPLA